MRRLDDSEIASIKETVKDLSEDRELCSLLAYGSQVAGYATEESDYDLIMVLRPFRQRVRYYYLDREAECSVLVVDPVSFENDCRKSSLGEFVSGRLLNAYYPIQGLQYASEQEITFKRRVILEGLADACADYAEFVSEVIFPLSYFLFEKLRKRAAIYPPVVYSYSKTYGNELLLENLDQSLQGFRAAASMLDREGKMQFNKHDDSVTISLKDIHSGLFSRIGAAASYTSKSLRQYAVHGYAGRVRPNVVGKEVLSKLSRSKRAGKLPEYILNPKISWTIPSGKLFATSHDWLTDLKAVTGMAERDCTVTRRSLGELYTSAAIYSLKSDEKILKFAVKKYHDITSMKWGVLNLWSLKSANFTISPIERIHREYRAINAFKNIGLQVPDAVAIFLDQKILVTRFIEGKDLSKIEAEYLNNETNDTSAFELFGRGLAKMHRHGYCMGDTKPSNALLSGDEIYFVDLEQAQPNGNKTWDIAEFIYFSARFTMKEERAIKIIGSFVKGYRDETGETSAVKASLSFRYRAPFQAFIAPNVMRAIRKEISR